MGYDRGDSFSFDFEPNEIPFGSKSKGKLSQRSYPIRSERKWKFHFSQCSELLFLPRKFMEYAKLYFDTWAK